MHLLHYALLLSLKKSTFYDCIGTHTHIITQAGFNCYVYISCGFTKKLKELSESLEVKWAAVIA